MLDQGHYTYRHNNILNFIVGKLDKNLYTVFSDIHGHQTTNGGTIPATMTVTQLKPDIVVINEKEKTVHILELTVPFEHNIKTRHTYKANKYSHFTRDITNYRATVIPFEVGARGYLTTENEQSLRKKLLFQWRAYQNLPSWKVASFSLQENNPLGLHQGS